jgi:thiopurine S-methyltransferase
MEAEFWHQRWQSNQIGFHEGQANAQLVRYFPRLSLAPGTRIFVPLCGKTRDIAWLRAGGYRVAAVELSQLAIEQLFAELAVQPLKSSEGKLLRYSAPGIDIFVGDLFDLTADVLGRVDATYDRAALVALPADMRSRYTAHLVKITHGAPQLLICLVYDQDAVPGPPFSIDDDEVRRQYAGRYRLQRIASADVPGGMKGKCAAVETVWMLAPGPV